MTHFIVFFRIPALILGVGLYSTYPGHDIHINERKGFLYGYRQTEGIVDYTVAPCNTVVFGNAQIITTTSDNTNIQIRVRVYNESTDTWISRDI